MTNRLEACPACARHIHVGEAACPFCGAVMPPGFGVAGALTRSPRTAATRAALLFAGAAVGLSCGTRTALDDGTFTEDAATDVRVDAKPGTIDSGSKDAAVDSGGPGVMYGPAPIGNRDASDDGGGPAPMYGPAPTPDE